MSTTDPTGQAGERAAQLAELLREQDLFRLDDGVVRVPHLVRGRLVAPPELPHRRIRSAFTAAGPGTRHLRLDGAQVIAEPLVDRHPDRPGTITADHRYLVLPDCDPLDLVEWDVDRLATGPYAAPYADVVTLLDATGALLAASPDLLTTAHDLLLATTPHRTTTLTTHLAALPSIMDGPTLRTTTDRDLSPRTHLTTNHNTPTAAHLTADHDTPTAGHLTAHHDIPTGGHLTADHDLRSGSHSTRGPELPAGGPPGTAYLDGWVPLPGGGVLRAVPTRQLHLAAERPLGAVRSLVRLLGSKGVGTVRLPVADVVTGALVAAALAVVAGANHPMVRHLSVVHWRDGDPAVEAALLAPGAFDRVVDGRTGNAKRSVALIDLSTVEADDTGAGAGAGETGPAEADRSGEVDGSDEVDGSGEVGRLAEVARLAAADVCAAELTTGTAVVHHVVGSARVAERYAVALRDALVARNEASQPVVPAEWGARLAELRRGRLAQASWYPDPLAREAADPDPLARGAADAESVAREAADAELVVREAAGPGWGVPTVVVSGGGVEVGELGGGGLVVVRVAGSVREAVGALGPGVGSVGVWPDEVRLAVRDRVAARGVRHVGRLGDGEVVEEGLAVERLVDWTRG